MANPHGGSNTAMNPRILAILSVGTLSFLGCASHGAMGVGRAGPAAPAYAPTSVGYAAHSTARYDMAPPAPPSVQSSADDSSYGRPSSVAPEAAPSERRGLATGYGEDRDSHVGFTHFTRGSSEPTDTAAIYYNDAQMAAMQAAHRIETTGIRWYPVHRDGVRVMLLDEGGNPLEGYRAADRAFVLGHAGQRYTIRLENRTPARFEALVTVDGLDVISGQPGSYGSRGYILPAYGHIDIEGFRRDNETVAAFRFSTVEDSYAAQTGDARNVGVIGLALFAELGARFDDDRDEVIRRDQANPFPGGYAPPPPRRVYGY